MGLNCRGGDLPPDFGLDDEFHLNLEGVVLTHLAPVRADPKLIHPRANRDSSAEHMDEDG